MKPAEPVGREWSQWQWEPTQSLWYRYRLNEQGTYEYDSYVPSTPGQAAPRRNVDELAVSLDNVDLGGHQDPTYTQGNTSYTYGSPSAAGGAAESTAAVSAYSSSIPSQPAYYAKGKGKGKASKEGQKDRNPGKKHRPKPPKPPFDDSPEIPSTGEREPFYKKPSGSSSTHQPHDETAYEASPQDETYVPDAADVGHGYDHASEPQTHYDVGTESTDPQLSGTGVPVSVATHDPQVQEHASHPDSEITASENLQEVLSQTDAYLTGAVGTSYSGGESSSMAATRTTYPYLETGLPESPNDLHILHAQVPANTTVPGGYPYQTEVTETVGAGQELGDGYNVEPSYKFRPGEVFMIIWYEPLGAGAPKTVDLMTQRVRVEHGGRSFYQGPRRFIVVANDEGHCTCVPILTYESQACRKRGVKPLKHGIVYQAGKRPRPLEGEPQLGFEPVRVNLYEATKPLVKESRVNYAKLVTVEHNFRVLFIGRVDPDDFQHIVIPAVDTCWQRKRRHN